MKKLLVFVGLVSILILSACSVPAAQATSQGAQQNALPQQQVNAAEPRTLSVTGSGQVTLAPDLAYINIGVHSESEDVGQALEQNNEKSQQVASVIQDLGIDPKDIQTSSFNIYPQPQWDPQTGQQTGTTFTVDNTVNVTVRDLQIIGQLLDVVVRSGANSINGISFDVEDKTEATTQARQLAVDDARRQAEELAQAAGVTLGGIQNLTISPSASPVALYEGRGGGAADAASQVPIAAGQLVIRVDVSASYIIQ